MKSVDKSGLRPFVMKFYGEALCQAVEFWQDEAMVLDSGLVSCTVACRVSATLYDAYNTAAFLYFLFSIVFVLTLWILRSLALSLIVFFFSLYHFSSSSSSRNSIIIIICSCISSSSLVTSGWSFVGTNVQCSNWFSVCLSYKTLSKNLIS